VGAHRRDLLGLETPKGGRVPEIETLRHRPSEHGVRPETRELGVIDCFSLRAH